MKLLIQAALACSTIIGLPAYAATNGCPEGSYSIILAPDGTALSILFDQFTVESGAAQKKVCRISAPLKLPANQSIGVYKVDYRGFAKLALKQDAELEVKYALGPHSNPHGRVFKRKVKGVHEGDYFFTETIGAGQMKRIGCGADAMLTVDISLNLAVGRSADGAKRGAMVYHLDLKTCP
jgi:hypothetical protein